MKLFYKMRMKKILLLLTFCLGVSTYGSKIYSQTFEGSIVLGFNLSQIDGDLLAGFNQIGLNGGVKVGVGFSDRWKSSIGLQFAQRGSRFGSNEITNSTFDKIRLNIVEVPLLAHFREWKFDVTGGFVYGRLINYEIIDVAGEDLSDIILLRDNIFSMALGATYYFNDRFGLEFLWTKSLNDIRADKDADAFLVRDLTFRMVFLL